MRSAILLYSCSPQFSVHVSESVDRHQAMSPRGDLLAGDYGPSAQADTNEFECEWAQRNWRCCASSARMAATIVDAATRAAGEGAGERYKVLVMTSSVGSRTCSLPGNGAAVISDYSKHVNAARPDLAALVGHP